MNLWAGTGDEAMDVLAWPGVDISGANASPPLVDCGQHPNLGGRIYLAPHHVVDIVKAIGSVLREEHRAQIAASIGAFTSDDRAALEAEIARLHAQIETLKKNKTVQLVDVLELVGKE